MPKDSTQSPACPVDCPGCFEPESPPDRSQELPVGWALAGISGAIFLVPLVFAVIGALIWPSSPQTQLLGTVLGGGIGALTVRRLLSVRVMTGGRVK